MSAVFDINDFAAEAVSAIRPVGGLPATPAETQVFDALRHVDTQTHDTFVPGSPEDLDASIAPEEFLGF